MNDLVEDLMKAMTDKSVHYRGVFIYPDRGKWFVYGKECETLQGAKSVIDESYKWVEESLKK